MLNNDLYLAKVGQDLLNGNSVNLNKKHQLDDTIKYLQSLNNHNGVVITGCNPWNIKLVLKCGEPSKRYDSSCHLIKNNYSVSVGDFLMCKYTRAVYKVYYADKGILCQLVYEHGRENSSTAIRSIDVSELSKYIKVAPEWSAVE